jgi:hypothetical protein
MSSADLALAILGMAGAMTPSLVLVAAVMVSTRIR